MRWQPHNSGTEHVEEDLASQRNPKGSFHFGVCFDPMPLPLLASSLSVMSCQAVSAAVESPVRFGDTAISSDQFSPEAES